MNDEFEALKELHDAGMEFDAAYLEVFGDDTAYIVEAFEIWNDYGDAT